MAKVLMECPTKRTWFQTPFTVDAEAFKSFYISGLSIPCEACGGKHEARRDKMRLEDNEAKS
jgi:hypothetical protein